VSGFDLAAYLADRRQRVDEALAAVLPPEDTRPTSVHQAMRYSLMAGGKRLRPILVIGGAEAVGGKAETVMPTACALELIHTYSLIHDDLPAMDDDDYRRGRLTNHKVFGEAIAILAGDALLTHAFRLIADNAARVAVDAAVVRDVIVEVVDAAGTRGMVGGQVVDIESEGKVVTAETLEYIHLHKTAALIRASLRVGAMLAGARADDLATIGAAGRSLGLAFQIVDDILDVEGTLAELGKSAGSDERKGKATYPALHGIEASRAQARGLIEQAKEELAGLGPGAVPLCALADYIFERRS
jgi:geranylgeranyl diphosphate synthase type II